MLRHQFFLYKEWEGQSFQEFMTMTMMIAMTMNIVSVKNLLWPRKWMFKGITVNYQPQKNCLWKWRILSILSNFLGHLISAKRVSPDSEKVIATAELSIPLCKAGLQRFVDMTACLAKSFPNLFNEPWLLRDLLRNDIIRSFTSLYVNRFSEIKEIRIRNSSLEFFITNLPSKVTCNSSKVGLGATLEDLQN